MLLLDSSGAIGGVLELPGDDYFIYGGGPGSGRVRARACVSQRGLIICLRVERRMLRVIHNLSLIHI